MNRADTYHHGNLREALIIEAGTVLEADGVDALSLRALARRLDVSHAAPAHHFANRAELLMQLATDGFTELADRLDAALASAGETTSVRAIGSAYIGFALDHPERYRLMFTSRLLQDDCPDGLTLASSRAFQALLQSVGRTFDDPGGYKMEAPELERWALVHGAVMLWLDGQLASVTDEAGFRQLVDAVIDRSTL